jgi:soluble lytic murein transglycosylase-like protein
MSNMTRRAALCFIVIALTPTCGGSRKANKSPPLYPNETPELREVINEYADFYEVPRALVQRVVIRESSHRPKARNGPYYGLMQILPQTARTMGYKDDASGLLDAEISRATQNSSSGPPSGSDF